MPSTTPPTTTTLPAVASCGPLSGAAGAQYLSNAGLTRRGVAKKLTAG